MPIIKFTNVKFYTGGGKVPPRIRRNQNYTIYVSPGSSILAYEDKRLINILYILTKGRVIPSKTTKVTRKKTYAESL